LSNDGTNSYAWDAENRMIKITYPGTGNYSAFSYDGLWRNVGIVETTAGSVTSTKQFVWSLDERCESRDASGSVLNQYFRRGERSSGTSYFWTLDHLGLCAASVTPDFQLDWLTGHPNSNNPLAPGGSVCEVTNSSGVIQTQMAYDPYGRARLLNGTTSPDIQYSGYYVHAPSSLCLTWFRSYKPSIGRWINRDPLGEPNFSNRYSYIYNIPTNFTDSVGLDAPVGGDFDPSANRTANINNVINFITGVLDMNPVINWDNARRRFDQMMSPADKSTYKNCPIPRWFPGNTKPLPSPDSMYPVPNPWRKDYYPGSPPWDPTLTKPFRGLA
jgi:RHS repeat-associated protein